jgi:hypothetical protein
LTNPQLLAVTDNVNQAKGDKGPEDWKPPLSEHSQPKPYRDSANENSELLLHIRENVDQSEERILTDGDERRKECAD